MVVKEPFSRVIDFISARFLGEPLRATSLYTKKSMFPPIEKVHIGDVVSTSE